MNRASIATSTSEQNSSRAVSSMGWMQESGPFFKNDMQIQVKSNNKN